MAKVLVLAAVLLTQTGAPIFRFETDGFWLNLHHFLYVLGRAELKIADSARAAVSDAPADEARGLAGVSDAGRKEWRAAVSVYADRVSRLDAVFSQELIAITHELRRAPAAAAASTLKLDPALASALDRAALIYRRVWWPAHQKSNRAWVESMRDPLGKYGARVLAYITRAYQESWAQGGYPVNVSGYTNWSGAYSTSGQLLVVSSLSPGNQGLQGFEITFHEAMHQWDDAVTARLQKLAAAHNIQKVDAALSHAMIFYTAGEAVRSVVPEHTPYADGAGIWKGRFGAFKAALDAHWKPYLDGKGTLDEALLALVRQAPITAGDPATWPSPAITRSRRVSPGGAPAASEAACRSASRLTPPPRAQPLAPKETASTSISAA